MVSKKIRQIQSNRKEQDRLYKEMMEQIKSEYTNIRGTKKTDGDGLYGYSKSKRFLYNKEVETYIEIKKQNGKVLLTYEEYKGDVDKLGNPIPTEKFTRQLIMSDSTLKSLAEDKQFMNRIDFKNSDTLMQYLVNQYGLENYISDKAWHIQRYKNIFDNQKDLFKDHPYLKDKLDEIIDKLEEEEHYKDVILKYDKEFLTLLDKSFKYLDTDNEAQSKSEAEIATAIEDVYDRYIKEKPIKEDIYTGEQYNLDRYLEEIPEIPKVEYIPIDMDYVDAIEQINQSEKSYQLPKTPYPTKVENNNPLKMGKQPSIRRQTYEDIIRTTRNYDRQQLRTEINIENFILNSSIKSSYKQSKKGRSFIVQGNSINYASGRKLNSDLAKELTIVNGIVYRNGRRYGYIRTR